MEEQQSGFADKALAIRKEATALKVRTDAEYEVAGEFLKACAALRREVEAFTSPVVAATYEAHKVAKAKENSLLVPIEEAMKWVGLVMGDFKQEAKRKAREKEDAARAKAQREAEERQLAEAEALEKAGLSKEAEAALEAPLVQEPVTTVVAPPPPKIAGTAERVNWKFDVFDSSRVPREYLVVDEKKIGRVVRATKGEIDIAGVRTYPEAIISAR